MMRALLVLIGLAVALGGCDREERKLAKLPSAAPSPATGERRGDLQPGQKGSGLEQTTSSRSFDGKNAFELAQGKRLFRWYNCSGCHSMGGGGMGPALMDNRWIYGHEPDDIYRTIMEGRPNGMPSFHGRIPDAQVWQIVGYVRSISGLAPKAAAPGRNDGLAVTRPENERERATPRNAPGSG
ncbi:MAG TPA: cytochrome c [Usitatibacter sp.]|jgi:cytochrome c oxidase cbb3-type subunit 3|nr:cytochrome c [Usitatibacter sp.]